MRLSEMKKSSKSDVSNQKQAAFFAGVNFFKPKRHFQTYSTEYDSPAYWGFQFYGAKLKCNL